MDIKIDQIDKSSVIINQRLTIFSMFRLKKSGNLDAIQFTKVKGGTLTESFLDEGFLLHKKPAVRSSSTQNPDCQHSHGHGQSIWIPLALGRRSQSC